MSKTLSPQPGDKLAVPPSGSLGLLAYGYKGLLAWRMARQESEFEKTRDKDNKRE